MSHELSQGADFEFVSPLALSHIISHNLDTGVPDVTVFDQATGGQIIPSAVLVLNFNQVQIDFFVPRAIAGKVD